MMLEPELQTELANAMAHNPHPNLALTKGLPDSCFVIVGSCLIKAGNNFRTPSKIKHGTSRYSSGNGQK
jgi:hypothetical protein